ncbi:cofactor assembly of complex C subunit B [Tumidithrix elongata RA019]|uniref:Cofactor assembly of complex C subunit B n=1 Tax=Tumidithrix elongata BACA0141 TaxID=2716417 RepID=A0AAW9Q512_9CYAN|nr:cofactor assembly of complex C subunit B [Tumidithrix elongata RA019]
MTSTAPALYSTLFLTALLFVGLLSFLKSSVKERTTEQILKSQDLNDDRLLQQVRDHLRARSYQVVKLDPAQELVVMTGLVKPSMALALLLVCLAAIGFGSLGLVLGILIPDLENIWMFLVLASPIAGVFYWRGAERQEEISLQLRSESRLWVRGHKDELTALARSLNLEQCE